MAKQKFLRSLGASRKLKALFRAASWWAVLSALLAGGAVCQLCGQPNCQGGAGAACILGALG
ncbi:MAG: hypothetical protein ACUVTH_15290, partial [Thermogutta sp.]